MSLDITMSVPDHVRDAVEKAGRQRRYGPGQAVFHLGDTGDSLHLVLSGRLVVRVNDPEGRDTAIAVLGPGEFFGEMAVFANDQERTATIVALEDVTTLELRRDPLAALRAAHPEINDLLLRLLAERGAQLIDRVHESLFVGVNQRVARRVYEVGRHYFDKVLPVVVPLTQEEIATLAGTTRPSANQALKLLESRGMLHLARGRVEITDPKALRRFADL